MRLVWGLLVSAGFLAGVVLVKLDADPSLIPWPAGLVVVMLLAAIALGWRELLGFTDQECHDRRV